MNDSPKLATPRVNGWIGFDLDGTLATYDGWKGIEHIGEPVAPMVERLKEYITLGIPVKILTARVSGGNALNVRTARRVIQDWLEAHGMPRLEVTSVKDYGMVMLFDDRAIAVERNTGAVKHWDPMQ